jgi:hypothetical protein
MTGYKNAETIELGTAQNRASDISVCVNVPARISESGKRDRKFFVTKSEAERYSKIHRVRIEKSRTEAARRSNAKKRDPAIEQTLTGLESMQGARNTRRGGIFRFWKDDRRALARGLCSLH